MQVKDEFGGPGAAWRAVCLIFETPWKILIGNRAALCPERPSVTFVGDLRLWFWNRRGSVAFVAGFALVPLCGAIAVLSPWFPTVCIMTVVVAAAVAFGTKRACPDKSEWLSLWNIFLLGLVLRVIGAALLWCLGKFGGWDFIITDEYQFWYRANTFADEWHLGNHIPVNFSTYYSSEIGYEWYSGLLVTIFGPYRQIVTMSNVLLASLAVPFIYVLARESMGTKIARTAALLTAVFPNAVLWAGTNLKESVSTAAIVIGVVCIASLHTRFRLWRLLVLFAAIGVLSYIRQYAAYVLLFVFIVDYMLHASRRPMRAVAGFSTFVVLLLVMSRLLLRVSPSELIPTVMSKFSDLAGFYQMGTLASGNMGVQSGSMLLPGSLAANPVSLLKYSVLGFIHILFTPLPWKPTDVLRWVVPGSIVVYILLPFMAIGFLNLARRWREGPNSTAVLFATLFLFVVGVATLGANVRHRDSIAPILMFFAAVGFRSAGRWKHLLACYYAAFALMLFALVSESIFVYARVILLTAPAAALMFWLMRRRDVAGARRLRLS